MIIYQSVKRFNILTGEPYLQKEFKEIRCDFTGEVIDEDLGYSYCNYHLNYGNADPCFGSGEEEYDFCHKYDIDAFTFLSDTYHFIQDHSSGRCTETEMMIEHLKDVGEYDMPTFANMCRASRIETAQKLIDAGTIKASDLRGDDEDEEEEEDEDEEDDFRNK